MELTQEQLKNELNYDPDTGIFTWKSKRNWKTDAGYVAGHENAKGYVVIKLHSLAHKAHRLAWLYMTGSFPEYEIDHINGIRNDNRFCNLRAVDMRTNHLNKKVHREGNPPGARRHSYYENGWTASIRYRGKRHHLGTFFSEQEAHQAYMRAYERVQKNESIDDLVEAGKSFKGLPGTTFNKDTRKWRASLKHNGNYYYLGQYETEQEAHDAFLECKKRLEAGKIVDDLLAKNRNKTIGGLV